MKINDEKKSAIKLINQYAERFNRVDLENKELLSEIDDLKKKSFLLIGVCRELNAVRSAWELISIYWRILRRRVLCLHLEKNAFEYYMFIFYLRKLFTSLSK